MTTIIDDDDEDGGSDPVDNEALRIWKEEQMRRQQQLGGGGNGNGGNGGGGNGGGGNNRQPPEPGKGNVLPDHPHREWCLLLIRQRFLQIRLSTATLATAPTAQQIVDELAMLQYGTTDAYSNVIPLETGKITKVKALRELKKKVNGKDAKDRDCVQAYLDDLLKTSDKEARYQKLREELLDRKPLPSRTERKERKRQCDVAAKKAEKKADKGINWTLIVITIIVCATLLLFFRR